MSRVQPEPAVTQDSVERPATKIVPDEQYVRLDALLAVDSTRVFTPLAWLKNMHSAPSAEHVREAGRQVRRLVACFRKREKTHEITGRALMDASSPQTDND